MDAGKVSFECSIGREDSHNFLKVAELDTPETLLAKKDSIFFSLANEAGVVGNTTLGSMEVAEK